MNRIQKLINLLLLTFLFCSTAGAEVSSEKFRQMVRNNLNRHDRAADSMLSILPVRGLGEGQRDFLIAPIVRHGKLAAIYADDHRRQGIKEIASSLALKTIKLQLLHEAGVANYLKGKNLRSEKPYLISLGAISLFGSVGVGWYIPAGDSYYLLSLRGKLISEKEVIKFWPAKGELIRQISATKVIESEGVKGDSLEPETEKNE
ncbi:MAG: hypothetical protein KAT58_07700 [candidate division Zixibacteria bacterium]|nr:hypothetical protein [candidate division Zixibacteria bacterium]